MAKHKKSSYKKPKLSKLEKVLLVTAVINLISAIIGLITKLI